MSNIPFIEIKNEVKFTLILNKLIQGSLTKISLHEKIGNNKDLQDLNLTKPINKISIIKLSIKKSE